MSELAVELLSGQIINTCVEEGDKVSKLRQDLSKTFGVAPTRLRLLSEGCELSDSQLVAEVAQAISAIVAPAWRVLSGSNAKVLEIWDLDTMECRGILEETAGVKAVSVDSTFQYAVGLCSDATLSFWDLENMEQTRYCDLRRALRLRYRSTPCSLSVDWVAHRAAVAVDESCHIVDLQSMESVGILHHKQQLTSVLADFASMRAVIGSSDKTLQVYDLRLMDVVAVLQGHQGSVCCLSVDFELHRAVSGSIDTQLGIWDLEKLICICFCKCPSVVTAVSANFEAEHIVSGCRCGTLCVWDPAGNCLSMLTDPACLSMLTEVTAISLDFKARRAVSASRENKLRVWDLSTQQCTGMIPASNVVSLS